VKIETGTARVNYCSEKTEGQSWDTEKFDTTAHSHT